MRNRHFLVDLPVFNSIFYDVLSTLATLVIEGPARYYLRISLTPGRFIIQERIYL